MSRTDEIPPLKISGLVVELRSADGLIEPVRGVHLEVGRGHQVGLVGESGSGKSLTALAVMGLLPNGGRVADGVVRVAGKDTRSLSRREWARLRGKVVSMIYQDPMSSLNPIRTVGDQIVETLRAHQRVSKRTAADQAADLLSEVGITNAKRRIDAYPHELSGGMRQRVMIAMAISCGPDLLLADEPTTALDVATQARIMELLSRLAKDRTMGVLLITHDLALASTWCDSVAVMYAGRIVEYGAASQVFGHPCHPYSKALLESICSLDRDPDQAIEAIGGQPPLPSHIPGGCSFHPRCRYATELCHTEVSLPRWVGEAREVECHYAQGFATGSAMDP